MCDQSLYSHNKTTHFVLMKGPEVNPPAKSTLSIKYFRNIVIIVKDDKVSQNVKMTKRKN